MHGVVRRYRGAAALGDALASRSQEVRDIIGGVPGFVAYYAFDAGGGVVSSVSLFEDQAGAEESNRRAADWVKQNLNELVPNPPQVTAGQVLIQRAR